MYPEYKNIKKNERMNPYGFKSGINNKKSVKISRNIIPDPIKTVFKLFKNGELLRFKTNGEKFLSLFITEKR